MGSVGLLRGETARNDDILTYNNSQISHFVLQNPFHMFFELFRREDAHIGHPFEQLLFDFFKTRYGELNANIAIGVFLCDALAG